MNKYLNPKYRPDIDGLRAVAVLAVVAFHAFPNWVKGGFIGVDIFFVISGYLIATIIFENLDAGTFSISEFYSRRIKRIFPALILVLATCFVFGWLTLLADEFKQLSKHIAAGAGFISNIVYWSEADYFDKVADTKPLLHLWSLGVEEQFYIVWPILLWFSWKRKFNLFTLTALLAITSYILNINGIKQDALATFYSPQTRFWELLSGSLLAWVTLYKKNAFDSVKSRIDSWLSYVIYNESSDGNGKTLANALSFIGSFLLLYGFWRINKELPFPGELALAPVLGALLLILAGPKVWINRAIFSNKIAVWFGLISYPLYLWHWPILSFARIVEGQSPSRNIRIAAVFLSISLAWLTYKFVEQPLRFGGNAKIKTFILVLLMGAVGYVGYNAYSRDGLPFRAFNQKFYSFGESIKFPDRKNECFEIPYAYKKEGDWFCNLGQADSPVEYFAYGDSHAASLIPALEEFAIENKLRIQFTGTSGCPSVLGIQSMRGEAGIEMYNCKELNERVFNYVKSSGIKSVILTNRWTYYTKSFSRPASVNLISRDLNLPIDSTSSTNDLIWAMENTVARYSSIGVKVIFIEDNPQQIYEPIDILRIGRGVEATYLKLSVTADEHSKNQSLVNKALRSTGAKVINLDDILCNEKICPIAANSKFFYADDDHLSIAGALLVSQHLSIRLKQ